MKRKKAEGRRKELNYTVVNIKVIYVINNVIVKRTYRDIRKTM